MYDIAVIGCGAAGLMAAIFAGRAGARVVAYDGAKRIGAKILISGGGRCNVTHDVVTADDFNGNRNAIAKVLRTFGVAQTIAFFEELDVKLKREETGKLFPVTDRARTVLDALLQSARDAGVEIVNQRIESLDDVDANRIILATGGRSVPKTGSDGHGYTIARAAGHSVTEIFPALVPLILEHGHWAMSLSGTSVVAELSVRDANGRILHRETGSMLFTHFGISGPVVLDISRHWIMSRGTLVANFLPGETFESLERALLADPARKPSTFLRGRIPDRLIDQLAPQATKLTRDERRRFIRNGIEQPLPLVGDRGFDFAEVTAGGVPLAEVDIATMASRKRDGLYLCGEILDVDGKIGGYNFQWAWCSGRLAGIAAASP